MKIALDEQLRNYLNDYIIKPFISNRINLNGMNGLNYSLEYYGVEVRGIHVQVTLVGDMWVPLLITPHAASVQVIEHAPDNVAAFWNIYSFLASQVEPELKRE